jgi:hypothetical protein
MRTIAELRMVVQAGKQRDPGWYRVQRELSIHVTRAALGLGLEADQVSLLMMGSTLTAALCLASASGWVNAAGFAFAYVGFLLDKVDGEVARLRGRPSLTGILLDRLHHRLLEPLLLLAIGWHEYQLTGSLPVLAAGFAAMLLAGVVDENQHLAPAILLKHVRQGGAMPDPAGAALPFHPSALARWHRRLQPLKAARTVALSLPIAAVAYGLERMVGLPVPTWCLVTGALALGAFLFCQCAYYCYEGIEREAAHVANVMRRSVVKTAADDAERWRR